MRLYSQFHTQHVTVQMHELRGIRYFAFKIQTYTERKPDRTESVTTAIISINLDIHSIQSPSNQFLTQVG